MDREVVLYGVAVGAGALVLGIGVYLGGRRWFHKSQQGSSNPYEGSKMVNEYMAFHYTPPEDYMNYVFGPKEALDFPKRCAELCLKHKQEGVLNRALEVGCGVGRATFELAREFPEVVGIDYSQAFVSKCQELKLAGQADYWMCSEGDLGIHRTAYVDPTIDRSRVQFMVGNACDLPSQIGQFGCVFGGNMICRLPEPLKFLKRLPDLLVPGGILVITSTYTWLEQYTEKEKWIGGFTKDGKEVRGIDTLKNILGPHFDLIEEQYMPFLIRETANEHQWTVSHATVWKRKC